MGKSGIATCSKDWISTRIINHWAQNTNSAQYHINSQKMTYGEEAPGTLMIVRPEHLIKERRVKIVSLMPKSQINPQPFVNQI